jgi:small subunit ribosomal protein S5
MARRLPINLRINGKGYRPKVPFNKRHRPMHNETPTPETIGLHKNPDIINRIATNTHGRGIRTTGFRLPYLSNLKQLDPVFDDPYEVAAATIRKTRKPGDPEVVLDPDGIYEEDDLLGYDHDMIQDDTPSAYRPRDEIEDTLQKEEHEALIAATGVSAEYIRALKHRPLIQKYVTSQSRNGKIANLFHLSVVGDGKGLLGMGVGIGPDETTDDAAREALQKAVRSMRPVERYENRTVYGDVEAKFAATKVILRSRPPGFGIRANYYVHEVCRCAGITDVSGKVRGSMNGMNIIKATFAALNSQKLPSTIARQRGRHVIDVRERYFHGR